MKKDFPSFVRKCQRIGTEMNYAVNDLVVRIKILDYRNTWGCERYLITPVTGSGERWVNITSLRS